MALGALLAALAVFVLVPAAASTLAAANVNISGRWHLDSSYEEDYSISAASLSTFDVLCSGGPCTAWHTAKITVTDEATRALAIAFDSGVRDTGTADAADPSEGIAWTSSAWTRMLPPRPLVVHVCPSTHMDPGWFQTLDELYESLFRYTVLNATAGLAANPARTYAAEITSIWALFVGEFGASGREQLRALIATAQLEFVGGGWVQPDEAITRFEDLLDERALGHAFLTSVLGHAPVRVGYSADPFGHSATQAYLSALNAYDAHVLGRPMSPLDPINAGAQLWHPLSSMPDAGSFAAASTVLTLSNGGYWEPYRSMDKNDVGKAAGTLLSWARGQAAKGQTNILMILGDDAPMQAPWAELYEHLDAVLAALNANTSLTNATFLYSTPSRWTKALAAEAPTFSARPEWDMVPLVGNEFPYWTGYYVSRPDFKQIYHDASAFFRGASMLHALASDERTWFGGVGALLTLWRALGIAQHHDIITGDCSDSVAEDNALRVRAGLANAALVGSEAAALLTGSDGADVGGACTNLTLAPCPALIAALESRTPTTLTLFNPLGWAREELLSFLSPTASVVVSDSSGAVVPSQAAPFSAPDLPPTSGWFSVAFLARTPALGAASYVLTATARVPEAVPSSSSLLAAPLVLSNAFVTASFSSNGTLQSVQAVGGPELSVLAKVLFYSSKGGSENAWDFSTDGSTAAADFPGASSQAVAWTAGLGDAGALFQELAVVVDAAQGVLLRYLLYSNEAQLHVFTSTGPFASNATSADAILRLETSIASGGGFLSDSNGLELHARRRWARPFTPVNYTGFAGNEPVAINMYPVSSIAVLPDADPARPALALVSANSHAVTSMIDGHIELTLNRNVLDNKGVRYTGNRLVTQHNILLVGATLAATTTAARRSAAALSNPLLAFASSSAPAGAAFAPLGQALPPQLALVSLQLLPAAMNLSAFFADGLSEAAPPVASGWLLLRLRHAYQAGLDEPAMAAPASVDLAAVFAPRWAVAGAVEMVADGSAPMAAARAAQTQWQQQAGAAAVSATATPVGVAAARPVGVAAATVTLQPMELKTLLLLLA